MRHLAPISLLALTLAGAPLAAQTAPGGFRLPTPTPTPTDIQGPVDPDAPILTRPRDTTPTPTPAPSARPTPAPTPAPIPRATTAPAPRPVASPASNPLPPRTAPPVTTTAEQPLSPAPTASPLPSAPTTAETLPSAPLPGAAATPLPAPLPTAPAEEEGLPGWLYALAGALVLAGAAAALWWRRRSSAEAPSVEIERPRVPAAPGPTLAAAPPLTATGPQLTIEARAVRLSRSMMFATLSYEMVVTNRSAQPLRDLRLGADLVTAHARIPTDQQLADPQVPLAQVKTFEQLDPGASVQFAGELRLPVSEIRPIPHGKAVVYVPLLRVRAEADGVSPIARTFVVGVSGGASRRLQPFRLDEMPQTYSAVSQHALD